MKISFYLKTHQYFDEVNREYIPVNKLIDQYIGAFDADAVADKVSEIPGSIYYGKTREEIIKEWGTTAKIGTDVHKAIENYIKNGVLPADEALRSVVQKFSRIHFSGSLLSEVIVYDATNLIAGTVDIVEQLPDLLKIWDLKTSRKITDDKHYRYSIQLGLYKYLLNLVMKMRVEIGGIIWIKDFVHLQGDAQIERLGVDSCIKDVREIVNARKIELWKEKRS